MLYKVGYDSMICLMRNYKIEIFKGQTAIFEGSFESNPHEIACMHKDISTIGHTKSASSGTQVNSFGSFSDMTQSSCKNIQYFARFRADRLF